MLQAMAGQGGISGGGAMAVNPMMAMMGGMAGGMAGGMGGAMGGMGGMGGMGAANMMQDKKMRELYVGNVPAGVTDGQLKEVLGGAMQQVGVSSQATWSCSHAHRVLCLLTRRAIRVCTAERSGGQSDHPVLHEWQLRLCRVPHGAGGHERNESGQDLHREHASKRWPALEM
jgi:hypothetical protein